MDALLVFIIATLEIVFLSQGPFGDNVFKNPARYVSMQKPGLE